MQVCQVCETHVIVTCMGLNPPLCVASRKKRKANGRLKSHYNTSKQEIIQAQHDSTVDFLGHVSHDWLIITPASPVTLPGEGRYNPPVNPPTRLLVMSP